MTTLARTPDPQSRGGITPRRDSDLVFQTLELARTFHKILGHEVEHGHRFDLSKDPREKAAWKMAVTAQEQLTGANMAKALAAMAPEPEDEDFEIPVVLAPYCMGCGRRHEGKACAYRSEKRR